MDDENVDDNLNANQHPWLLHDALASPGRKHYLPKHLDFSLQRFNPNLKE